MKKNIVLALLFTALMGIDCVAQSRPKFNYAAQKKLIPVDLGQIYLGMSFRDFAKMIDLKEAVASSRFGPLELNIPYSKGNIKNLTVRIHGLDEEETAAVTRKVIVVDKYEHGNIEREVQKLDIAKIPAKGFVYAIYILFNEDFDLKAWSMKTFGKPGDVYKEGDNGYFYDLQWTKKTADGLTWLIRCYYEENKSLQLLGRIKGTEWGTR